MNKKSSMSPQRIRERALFLYASALESGDFDTVSAVLKLAERDAILDRMLKDLDATAAAPEAREESASRPYQNGKGIHQNVIIRHAPSDGRPSEFDPSQEDTDKMLHTTFEPTIQPNPKTLYPFAMRFITLAAAILILGVFGGLLIQMVNHNPSGGYPGASSQTQTSPIVCDPASDYMAQGEANIASGDYAAALTAYNCAIELDPGNATPYLLRGGLAAAAGDYDQSGYDFYAFNVHTLLPNGAASLITQPVADILPTITSAIKDRPDDAVLYWLRGLILNRTTLGGGEDFVRFREVAPGNAVGYLMTWTAITNTKDENIQKGIELAPDSALLDWVLWGSLTQENAAFAQPYFDRAIQANPAHPFAYEARARTEVILGDTEAATRDFYQHIQNNQTDVTELGGLKWGEPFTAEVVPGGVYRLPFTAEAGQKLNVTAVRSDRLSGLGPTVVVLNPAGEVMPAPYTIGDNVAVSPPIEGLEIRESGTYALLVKANQVSPMMITIDAPTLTRFSSKQYALPMNLSFNAEWYITDNFTDLVTVKHNPEGWELGFNIVTNATVADPISGYKVPFPADFASWIQSNPDFQTDQPTQVTVGGVRGLQIDATPTVKTRKDFLYLSTTGWKLIPEPEKWRFILLDSVHGERLLVLLIAPVDQFDAAIEKAQAVLNEVVFST